MFAWTGRDGCGLILVGDQERGLPGPAGRIEQRLLCQRGHQGAALVIDLSGVHPAATGGRHGMQIDEQPVVGVSRAV